MTVIGKSALDDLQVPLPRLLQLRSASLLLADLSNQEQKLMRELAEKKEKLVNGIQMRWATEVSADGRR